MGGARVIPTLVKQSNRYAKQGRSPLGCSYLPLRDNSDLVFYAVSTTQRVPKRFPVIGFFNPVIQTQNLVQSSNLAVHLRAYFQSGMSSQFCFKISNPELQMREIPYPEKRIRDPQHSTDSTAKRRGSSGMPICSSFW